MGLLKSQNGISFSCVDGGTVIPTGLPANFTSLLYVFIRRRGGRSGGPAVTKNYVNGIKKGRIVSGGTQSIFIYRDQFFFNIFYY